MSKEEQVYEVVQSTFRGKHLVGSKVTLDYERGGRWSGPWYWGYMNVVEPKKRFINEGFIHDKVILKKLYRRIVKVEKE